MWLRFGTQGNGLPFRFHPHEFTIYFFAASTILTASVGFLIVVIITIAFSCDVALLEAQG